MSYFTGLLVAVPNEKKNDYIALSEKTAAAFRENGATRVVEAWGDDVPDGETTSFPMAVKLKDGETVVFSFIEWPDKATATSGLEKAMADPRMDFSPETMPFDGKRLMWGSFETIVSR
ncbi:DUF1428 domain-containing protein [Pseudohoeflea coraliihabitans]|uniref:DUF1428 domain-containing protein n=1 Tax=Pseudohoeflea coraliihabitans TaxID=2860393 RepID=A0ABS6WSX9_9HYPH|nr:DUF1428 domain-containing protein [Pseudohoeflea sp. DP4N28-3]MBW3098748.1 DUF1428 domain-containing protein [Pseudohoeflea sp. DP4N28-3]